MELTRQNPGAAHQHIVSGDRSLRAASLKRAGPKADASSSTQELDDLVLHDASHRYVELIVHRARGKRRFFRGNERCPGRASSSATPTCCRAAAKSALHQNPALTKLAQWFDADNGGQLAAR